MAAEAAVSKHPFWDARETSERRQVCAGAVTASDPGLACKFFARCKENASDAQFLYIRRKSFPLSGTYRLIGAGRAGQGLPLCSLVVRLLRVRGMRDGAVRVLRLCPPAVRLLHVRGMRGV